MYSVDDSYKEAMHQPVQTSYIFGYIGAKNYQSRDLVEGSVTISNQISDSTDLTLGATYIGQFNATFRTALLERGEWVGQTITVVHSLYYDDTHHYIPLGTFTVASADWTSEGVEVVAYDAMAKLDKSLPKGLTATGDIYSMLKLVCDECGVTMGQSPLEVGNLPNGQVQFSIYPDNSLETYRDLLSAIAQVAGGYATVNRFGYLVIKTWQDTTVDSLDREHRFMGAKFSDFTTSYTGLSWVDAVSKTTRYYSVGADDGSVINLGNNPLLQSLESGQAQTIAEAILMSLSKARYSPFKASYLGCLVYDLGDVIEFTGGLAGDTCKCCLMSYTWRLHNTYDMAGFGADPRLATAKSKSDKDISGLMNSSGKDSLYFSTYVNSEDIRVGDGETKTITNMRLATSKATHVRIVMEYDLSVETTSDEEAKIYDDARARFRFFLSGTELVNRDVIETWQDGRHVITTHHDADATGSQILDWVVKLNMNGGSVDIPPYGIYISAFGAGLVGDDVWTGVIELEEEWDPLLVSMPGNLEESVSTTGETETETKRKNMLDTVSVDVTRFFRLRLEEEVSN